jgi:hypothetical protein
MSIRRAYETYRAECAKTDAGHHGGASLRLLTPQEEALYNEW